MSAWGGMPVLPSKRASSEPALDWKRSHSLHILTKSMPAHLASCSPLPSTGGPMNVWLADDSYGDNLVPSCSAPPTWVLCGAP